MSDHFSLKTGSAEQAKAAQRDYQESQKWCNFVLLKPTWLPSDVKVAEQSLRPEQPNQNASYRLVLSSAGRSLSIKQFLFDFAPPAYDHPSLWRNPNKTAVGDFPPPRPLLLRDNVLWLGRDHRRLPAATVGFHRVRVEVTVLGGEFSDQELLGIAENLVPADEVYAQTLRNTPFAILAYQHRHPQKTVDVPLSYWRYKRSKDDVLRAHPADSQTLASLPAEPPILDLLGYTLDSIFTVESESDSTTEIDFIFEAKEQNGAYLRLLLSPTASHNPIPHPPEKYTQKCRTKTFKLEAQTVHQAWLTDRYGPYEAVFLYQGHSALLLAQPAAWTNESWFHNLLRTIFVTR